MINKRIQNIIDAIHGWCTSHGLSYDIICDEHNFQVMKIFKVSKPNVDAQLDNIYDMIIGNNVHVSTRKVRSGIIIAISLKAISEQQMDLLAESIDGNQNMSFPDRINSALTKTIKQRESIPELHYTQQIDFDNSAVHIIEHNKPKKRFKTSLSQASTHAEFGASKGSSKRFDRQLDEALDQVQPNQGQSNQTQQSPDQLFNRFSKALNILGQNLGIGPLQNVLKQRGIKWKKSDDGKNIILYVINADTNAPQPIETINVETLDKPHDFQEQLTHMLDYAQGEAPGSFLRQQQLLRDQDKLIRDVAQSVSPDAGVQASKIAATPKL